jgi:hypothetical protein
MPALYPIKGNVGFCHLKFTGQGVPSVVQSLSISGTGPISSLGYVLGLLIGSVFIVIEARIDARLSKLETRVSSIKLRDSIRASSPLDVKLSHEKGFVSVTQKLDPF